MPTDATEPNILRPALVREVLKIVNEGGTVNLYGPTGSGKGRFIDDLKRIKPEELKVLPVHYHKNLAQNYDGWIQQICTIGNIPYSKKIQGITEIVRKVKKPEQPLLVIIHDFHYFYELPQEKKYGTFIDHLNSIKSMADIGMIVLTRKNMRTEPALIGDQSLVSPFYGNPIALTDLLISEIFEELRTKDEQNYPETTLRQLSGLIAEASPNYQLMVRCLREIQRTRYTSQEIHEKFEEWKTRYHKENRDPLLKKTLKGEQKIVMFEKLLQRPWKHLNQWGKQGWKLIRFCINPKKIILKLLSKNSDPEPQKKQELPDE